MALPTAASARTIEVLWYTYADPSSVYVRTMTHIAGIAGNLPRGGIRWNLTWFRPESPTPDFRKYDVLVIQSGEAFFTGRMLPFVNRPDPVQPYAKVDFSGILKHRAQISAARGERTFVSGSDADVHAIQHRSGTAPDQRCPSLAAPACWDGALGHLVNAVNWAASGRGLGIVSLLAAEFPDSYWWLHEESFLRQELQGYVTFWRTGYFVNRREDSPIIPAAARSYALNAGLSSQGLSGWVHSFHAGFTHGIPGYLPVVDATRHPNTAVAIATAKWAAAGFEDPSRKR